jgi:hypothetical protein
MLNMMGNMPVFSFMPLPTCILNMGTWRDIAVFSFYASIIYAKYGVTPAK